jgi:hypothetical protein
MTVSFIKKKTCQDDCKKLQSDLDAAARWEADWLMAFHQDKCTVLTITQKKTPFKHDYILHNHIREPVTSAKYLGVTLQSNLKKLEKELDRVLFPVERLMLLALC